MKLDLETEIRYPEGDRAGVIRQVILNDNNSVGAIVMSTGGLISRDVIVPLDLLSEEAGGIMQVNLSPDDLPDLEEYTEERVAVLPERWEMRHGPAFGGDVFPEMINQPIVPVMDVPDLPDGAVSISQNTALWCLDGEWGVVDDVLVDDNGQAYALIGRAHATTDQDRIIPMDLVSQVDTDRATLNCTLADLATYTQETQDEAEEPELN